MLNPGNSELEKYLIQHHFQILRISYTGKKDIPRAIISTYKFLRKTKTEIVHTHLFDAGIVGLTAAKLAGIKKRIYTRHHSTYHHDYFPKAVKYDKLCNYLATDIVAISANVSKVLNEKENVKLSKIHLIHHGFKLDLFENVPSEDVELLRNKYNLTGRENHYPVIGVISRYTQWKGIQYIIPAFKLLLEQYPDALLILANAEGDYKSEIKQLLKSLPEKNYLEIAFEKELFALYKLFDYFVHVPINNHAEAYGQVYIESLAAGIPTVFTLSGIANEFIKDHNNALIVPYQDSDAIFNALIELMKNKNLVSDIITKGKKDVNQTFSLHKMIVSLEKLYGE